MKALYSILLTTYTYSIVKVSQSKSFELDLFSYSSIVFEGKLSKISSLYYNYSKHGILYHMVLDLTESHGFFNEHMLFVFSSLTNLKFFVYMYIVLTIALSFTFS